MKKIYTNLRRDGRLLGATLALLGLGSCFDDTLDIQSKDVSMEIQIFNEGITLPLGSILPIYLSEYLDFEESDGLSVSSDGLITITQSGDPIEQNIEAISTIEVEMGEFDPIDITTEISQVNIDPIDIPMDEVNQELALPDLDINTGEAIAIGDNRDISANLSTQLSGITLSEGAYDIDNNNAIIVPVDGSSDNPPSEDGTTDEVVSFDNKDNDGNYPDLDDNPEVKTIELITFDTTEPQTITINAEEIRDLFNESDFNILYPLIEIEFPGEFNVSCEDDDSEVSQKNDKTYITITNKTQTTDRYVIEFDIDEYEKSFDDEVIIAGNITVTIQNPKVWGEYTYDGSEYNSQTPNYNRNIEVDFDIDLAVVDVEITTGTIEADVEMDENIGDDDDYDLMTTPIEITGLPESVSEITTVVFDADPITGGNTLTLTVDAVDLDPLTLDIDESDSVIIEFDSNLTFSGDSKGGHLDTTTNLLTIPANEFINANGYTNVLTLYSLDMSSGELTTEDDESGDQTLSMDLDITMKNTITFVITEGESITQSEYETLKGLEQKVVINLDSGGGLVVDKDLTEIETTDEFIDVTGDPQTISISQSLSTGDVELNRLYYGEIDPTILVIDITLEDVADEIGEMSFDGFKIDVPNFLVFSEDDPAYGLIDITDGEITIDLSGEVFTKSGTTRSYRETFDVVGFDFSSSEYDKLITDNVLGLDTEISYDGQIKIAAGGYSLNQGDIDGVVSFSIGELREDPDDGTESYYIDIISVNADIDMKVEMDPTSIDMSSLSDGLGEDLSISLVLTDPALKLVIKNPIPLDLEISSFTITLLDADGKEFGETINIADDSEFNIPAHEGDGEYTLYGVWVSGDDSVPTGVEFEYIDDMDVSHDVDESFAVKVDNLGDIFKDGIPSEVQIILTANVADPVDEPYYTIELEDSDYDLSIGYEVIIPLSVQDMAVDIHTEFDGLSDSMGDIIEYVSSIQFMIDAVSTIPLELTIYDVSLYDIDGEVIEYSNILGDDDVAVIEAATILSDGDTEAAESSIILDISNGDSEDLARLDKIAISISATTEEGSDVALYGTQSLSMTLKVGLPDGLTIDLSDEE